MRGLHVSSATFLKRGNFCDFLFIYLDGNPSKKGIEAVHVRLDFTKFIMKGYVLWNPFMVENGDLKQFPNINSHFPTEIFMTFSICSFT